MPEGQLARLQQQALAAQALRCGHAYWQYKGAIVRKLAIIMHRMWEAFHVRHGGPSTAAAT
jgi:hypothetical protein